ncbi:MAG: isoprenylcysteine carboxylmethyltransferase family protein [Desulfobacterales bacterium]
MHWLDYFIIATYIAQIYQVCFFAVPSAGSTIEMLSNRKRKSMSTERHPAAAVAHATPQMVGTIGATLAVLAASMIPLLTVVFPAANRYLLPFIKIPPTTGLSIISAGLLLLGNGLTFIAVGNLRANVSFHEFGETRRLYTAGIYRTVRNPITLGLGTIFAGFVLARPSAVMLIGLIIFALNSHYRIHMEEVYLEKTFGNDYLQYKDSVGKYVPKVGGHIMAKHSTIKEGEINPHHGDKMQE